MTTLAATGFTSMPLPGAPVEVFSRSQGGWMPGKVETVNGKEANVMYLPPGADPSRMMKKIVDWDDPEQIRPREKKKPAGGGTAIGPIAVGDSIEVYSQTMGKWVDGVVTKLAASNVTVSYTVEQAIPRNDTGRLRKSQKAVAAAAAAKAVAENKKTVPDGAPRVSKPLPVPGLPKLEDGDSYFIVQKAGGLGRAGAGMHMCLACGRTGIMLYYMREGAEHFKTYPYEDLRSWEASTNCIRFEKRRKRSGATPQTVEYATSPGQAMEIVEEIMKKVKMLTDEVKSVVEDLDIGDQNIQGPKLTKFFPVKKAAGRGRGHQMKLTCGQMGIQVFKKGEPYKTYYYKDLDEWATLCSSGDPDEAKHNRLILSKRERDGMTTEYMTNPGDAMKIALAITDAASQLAKAMRAERKRKKDIAAGIDPDAATATAPEPESTSIYNIGDKIQVYSRSISAWLPGEVVELDGEELKVLYTDGVQRGTKYVEAEDEESIRMLTASDAEALEEATTARKAAAEAAKLRAAQEAKEDAEREAAMLAAGKSPPAVAAKVQVYSRSQGEWLPGIVIGVEGVEAKVNYKSKGQIGEKWVYWADDQEMRVTGALDNVSSVVIELTKGPAGFGMAVTDSCHVTGYAGEGSVAELAGVPIGSRIVQVGPKPVKTKAELGAALGILPHGQVPSSALP
jgi:hypothetical protein